MFRSCNACICASVAFEAANVLLETPLPCSRLIPNQRWAAIHSAVRSSCTGHREAVVCAVARQQRIGMPASQPSTGALPARWRLSC